MNMTDNEVIKRFEDRNGTLFKTFKVSIEKPENKEYKEYLLNRFENVESPIEAIIMLRNNISEVPKCKTCGKLMHITNNKDAKRREYCSRKCMYASEERNFNVSKGLYKTWADDSKREEILGKTKETCQRKWGVDYPTQCREIVLKSERVQRNLERKKNYKTYRERFGVDRPLQNPEVHKRTQESYKRKTGFISPFQNPEVRKELQDHFRETYGGPTPFASEEIQKKVGETCKRKNEENPNRVKEINKKIAQSKTLNRTWCTTSFEEKIYQWLLKRFGTSFIIRQYKEFRYPWKCDFYIKGLDFFIEVQGHWKHGFHPFDENNPEDLEKVKLWKEKGNESSFYTSALKCWTITDVMKRETAKKNNLKYLEIFNYEIIEEVFWLEISRKITEWKLSNKK